MKFLFVSLDWQGLVSKKTYKIHLALPPLDLVLLSSFAAEHGHESQILDCFVDDLTRLPSLADQADWIVVATTPYHMWQCPNSEWGRIKEALKSFPLNKVILTGLHASIFPEQTLRETGVYAVIRREPEGCFKEYLENGSWKDCSAVSFLEGEEYRENAQTKVAAMDELVARKYDIDISKYGYFLLGKKTGVFEASRGCPWKCTFCDQEMYSWKYRTKTPAVFAEEVISAVRQTGMRTAYFYDLEFTVNKKRTLELCKALIDAGVPKVLRWCCQTRADTVDEDVIDALKAAGCVLIHFGVESANPDVLKATNKKITLEKIERGVRLAKRKKVQTACFFMFGLPGEKPEQFSNTLEFARSLNPTYASFHFAIPFPGTPLYDQYVKEKNLEWGTWPATYFDGWPHEDISRFLGSSYRKFYLMPKKFELREFMYRLENLPHKLRYFKQAAS